MILFYVLTDCRCRNCDMVFRSWTDSLCHSFIVLIWTLSILQKFGDQKYKEQALKCAEVVWQRGLLRKGYGLCHGVSGNAYTFLAVYKLSGDLTHLYRAHKVKSRQVNTVPLLLYLDCMTINYHYYYYHRTHSIENIGAHGKTDRSAQPTPANRANSGTPPHLQSISKL